MDLPKYRKLFFAYGPVLQTPDESPLAYGWVPINEKVLDENMLAELDRFGKWHQREDGVQVLVHRWCTIDELEMNLGPPTHAVVDADVYQFALYGSTKVHMERFDPRRYRKVVELTTQEFERTVG